MSTARFWIVCNDGFRVRYSDNPAPSFTEALEIVERSDREVEELKLGCGPHRIEITYTCPRCDDDGYLDESTLSKPVFCDCPIGVAKSKVKQ